MSIEDAARVVLRFWEFGDAVKMVAIAGAESGWRNDARGDSLSYFHNQGIYSYDPYDCEGYLSFGLWQIFQGVHHHTLLGLTGSSDPCYWRNWLFNPDNNGSMAFMIWTGAKKAGRDPFTPWSVYNNRAYLNYMAQALEAVERVVRAPPPFVPPGEVPGCRSALIALPWFALRGLKLALSRGVKRGRQYDPMDKEES